MMAGISSASNGHETVILEKMNTCGRKIRITGKGRCNVTNAVDMSEFIKNIPGNGKFLYSSFQNFTNEDLINLLKSEGLETKVERGNRVFPVTDNSQSVIDSLYRKLKRLNVKVITNAEVIDIIVKEEKIYGVKYKEENTEKEIQADKVIIASGGMSYKATGSTREWVQDCKKIPDIL